MKAWLERLNPAGDRISLPDDSGSIVFGRSSKATLVVDDARVSPRHCSVTFDAGFWRVRDLGSEAGTKVNGSALTYPRALFRGDVIELGATTLRFDTEEPADDLTLIAAIAAAPETPEPWLVYADWLLERGDPLGDRIMRSRAGERVDHMPWLGPLWDPFVSGEIELEWQFGFIKKAVVRPVVGHLPIDWRDAVSTLLGLRIGQLTRELVIDVPQLRIGQTAGGAAEVLEAQNFIAALPKIPSSLKRLGLGYDVLKTAVPARASERLALAVPALRDAEVYLSGSQARLRELRLEPGIKSYGINEGLRALTDVTRVRRGAKTQIHFETPPGIAFIAEGNPCHFSQVDGRWRLIAGRLKGEIRVNARVDSVYLLLPGDLIDVQAAGRFRFEVVP